ncbi:MAG: hypothetical protein ISR68_01400 [Campylobacterales bacterium]|nr:hypothetical protein [Campylobacterales bacterium]
MEAIYPYANIIHLILAIIFLGYVFTDLAVISAIKGKFNPDTQKTINQSLGKRSFKIFPLTLLLLILTGGMMMSRYMNSTIGWIDTPLQQILAFKIFLVLIITLGVLSNLFIKFSGRKKSYFMENHFHKLVIVLGLLIVICAKLMFL